MYIYLSTINSFEDQWENYTYLIYYLYYNQTVIKTIPYNQTVIKTIP